MPDTEALAERARIVAWLRGLDNWPYGGPVCAIEWADAIERGDHDYIAIPRLSLGDQKGVG